MGTSITAEFVKSMPRMERFSNAIPINNYMALPKDWYVAVTDVVASRKAIAEGRHKAVNMAGVSMISAIMNAVGNQDLIYIFGGDGAAVAFGPDMLETVRVALGKTVRWVNEDLELQLRAAIVPVAEVRKAGKDVLVVGVRVSEAITNYAFMGGGISWSEKIMKDGFYAVEAAAPSSKPDLSGLSCRWTPIEENGRKIISLIVEPAAGEEKIPDAAMDALLDFVKPDLASASPMPKNGPGFKWPPEGLPLEAKASGTPKLLLLLITVLAWVLDKTGWNLGKFDPVRYRLLTSANTDYRKIQDGLRMTVALDVESVMALRRLLEGFREKQVLKFGICEQDLAVLTCFVPSVMEDNHFHFLDGAGGGYSAAADDLH